MRSPNMLPEEELTKWLAYADIGPDLTQFVGGDYIVTNVFNCRSIGKPTTPVWEMEEWAVASVFVPVQQLEEARRVLTFHDLEIKPHWIDCRQFDFAVSAQVGDISIKPWTFVRKHPATGTHLVEIQRDFVIYHALDKRGSGDKYELVHPLDNLEVVRVRFETHDFYSPTLRLEVHRYYLQDFLAAAGLGMVVASVADRFRNTTASETVTHAQLQVPGDVEVSVAEMTENGESFWRARSILHRTAAIQPHEGGPQPERSPWHCFDLPKTNFSKLEFIADADGKRCTLD